MLLLALLPLVAAMPFDLSSGLASSVTYDEGFARNKMLPLAAAAYSSSPQQCLTKLYKNAQLKRLTSVVCDITLVDRCTAFTAVNNDDKAIILSYRGTDRNSELIMEGDETIFKNHTTWSAGGTVSKYFADAFKRLWMEGIKDDLTTLQSQNPTYELWITGHSLGGALASLAASYISDTKIFPANKIKLVTFGQPRTGDRKYAASVEKERKAQQITSTDLESTFQGAFNDIQSLQKATVPYTFRVTHSHDLVPHLPLIDQQGFYHHKTEAYYDKGMGTNAHYYVCYDMGESTFCSDGNFIDKSVQDHLHYFEKDVSDYGINGCK